MNVAATVSIRNLSAHGVNSGRALRTRRTEVQSLARREDWSLHLRRAGKQFRRWINDSDRRAPICSFAAAAHSSWTGDFVRPV